MAEKSDKKSRKGKFEDQFDDEEVLYVFRHHPIVMRRGLIVSMSAWLVGPLIVLALTYMHPDNPPSIATFFASLVLSIVLGCLILLPFWISWYFSVFIITTQRFIQITQKRLFYRKFVDMNLNQIQQINYEIAGLEQSLLGFGTIKLQTYLGDLVIHHVHHPAHTQRKILQLLREQGITAIGVPFGKSGEVAEIGRE